jgi:hypothetical protein
MLGIIDGTLLPGMHRTKGSLTGAYAWPWLAGTHGAQRLITGHGLKRSVALAGVPILRDLPE